MRSGGDWAQTRQGVLLFEGTEDVLVQECTFTRIDGNAIFLSGYNRRAVIDRNSFFAIGESAIAAWGRSVDWDGTGGQQPRHTLITGNLATEVGLQQKQVRRTVRRHALGKGVLIKPKGGLTPPP